MAEIKVLKVKISAVTSSFRYPQVMVGKIPTFDMPPPATIYGHLCGVAGEWFNPGLIEFAYDFKYKAKCLDKELVHVVSIAGNSKFEFDKISYKKNIEGNTNVQDKEFLFNPEMILYLKGNEETLNKFYEKFNNIEYSYILGRSQDLATCHSVDFIKLNESKKCYFENTILPWDFRKKTVKGFPVLMPKYIDYHKFREPVFEKYLQVSKGDILFYPDKNDFLFYEDEKPERFFADKSITKSYNEINYNRGVCFHKFV
jgi:CRISPR-associated protein Cas5t